MNTFKTITSIVSLENTKIFSQRKYKIYLIFIAFIIIAGAFISRNQETILKFTMSNYPYTVLSIINYVFAPIVVFMLVSDVFSSEMAGDEIKILITRPISRINILIGKTLSVIIYLGLIFLISLVLSGILTIILSGLISFNILNSILVYIIGFLPVLTIIAMGVMIACISKSGTTCFMLCLLTYLIFIVLEYVFSSISPGIFTSYLDIGSMLAGSIIPINNLLIGISILIGYMLVFISIGGMKFTSKEY